MGDVRVAVCLSLRLRRDFRVQHSYCFSLYSSEICSAYLQRFSSPQSGTFVLVLWYNRHPGGASPRTQAPSVRGNPMRLEFIRE
jgi:hypothetical protein